MKEDFLPEKDGHVISFTERGNAKGPAILSFHGGPGSRSKPRHAEQFDLTKYRVIQFDQRGCGKSTPLGELQHNTTDSTLEDAERIRETLGLDSWFVAGGSWGSTLSLLYALRYPKRVRGLLLASIFLADRDSVEWSTKDAKGAARFVPEGWDKRMRFFERFNIGIGTQNADLLRAFDSASAEDQNVIAAEIQDWEGNLFSTQSEVSFKDPSEVTETDIASVRVFLHYEMNNGFIAEDYILDDAKKLEDIPAVIVHGRYDVLCPLDKAYELKKKISSAELVIATSSGHRFTAEGEMIRKLAFARFLDKHAE